VDFDGIVDAICHGKYQFNTNDQPLWDTRKISDVWPQPPSDDPLQLHAYVSLPTNVVSPTGEYSRFVRYPEPGQRELVPAPQDLSPLERWHLVDYPWLEEVRSKVWKKKQLERDLFREVKVTQAHYTELQERLNEQHPDRDSPEYDGRKHDVRNVKLDVLRLIPGKGFSPRHPDNEDRDDDDPEASNNDAPEMDVGGPGASNEDGCEINSLFPFTLRFLDLTTLGLKNTPKRLPSPLFLRQEYDDISALIEAERRIKDPVVVSGQPGTGKILVSLSHRI